MNNKQTQQSTLLCLVNSAPFSRAYFEKLAASLERRGYRVVFVLDSHLSDYLHAGGNALAHAHYFTDYLKQRITSGTARQIAADLPWRFLYADFDRLLTLDIAPPLDAETGIEYKHIPQLLGDFFADIFAKEDPVAVVYEPVSNAFALGAFKQAKKAGIPFLSISPSRIPGRIEISTSGALHDAQEIKQLLLGDQPSSAQSQAAHDIAAEYVRSIDTQVPDYMKTNGLDRISLIKKYLNTEKLSLLWHGQRYRYSLPEDARLAFQHGNPLKVQAAMLRRALWRRLRLRHAIKHYESSVPEGDYFLYPIHYHPESSTSIYAPDFVDELSVIKSIAFRLPLNCTLCVKEHPSAVGLQTLDFYNQLTRLPNVQLLGPDAHTKTAIRKSKGVICVTSTVGFEAAVLNKPVVTLGNVFYSYFPNVKEATDHAKLDEALRWALNYTPVDPEALVRATAAYVRFGAPGSFDFKATLHNHAAIDAVSLAINDKLDIWSASR